MAMKNIDYKNYIKDVIDFPKEGIVFKDITTVLENGEVFASLIDDMVELTSHLDYDKIVCADARGFIFGAAIGYKLKKGVVIARKPGKLPRPGKSCSYELEYGSNTMIISEDSILPGEKVLIVDDLLATGGSAVAMMDIVEQAGGKAVGSVFFIELELLGGAKKIKQEKGTPVYSVCNFTDVL